VSRGATYYTLLAALRQQELLDEADRMRAARAAAPRRRRPSRLLAFPRLRRLVIR
jgi:hypothetical protein